jgi:aspartyl-tRNA synthetase
MQIMQIITIIMIIRSPAALLSGDGLTGRLKNTFPGDTMESFKKNEDKIRGMRTHTCGELEKQDLGMQAELCGWCHSRRDHGGVIFIDLRDRHGVTQIVFYPDTPKIFAIADKLRREDIIAIKGEVIDRPEGASNESIATGGIEILVKELKVISKAETPPIEIDDRIEAKEDVRLKYRYLDLRRPIMQKRLMMRHKIISFGRKYFDEHDFVEVSTPLLVKSTPEGARDYVVPSRVNSGQFYALPQSPQLYKQILMIAGMDRYYQVAPCLRDEDLRTDRQPEHYQFDFEMSFVRSEDVREFVEGLFIAMFKEVLGVELKKFPIMSYKESVDKYGTDKPDIRYELFLHDVTEIMKKSEFEVFKNTSKHGGIIKCIVPKKDFGRNELDGYIEYCQSIGAKGMAWMKMTEKGLESNITKYFSPEVLQAIIETVKPEIGSVLMFIADKPKKCNEILSKLRTKLAEDMKLFKPGIEGGFALCWVKDFPLFAWNESEQRWEPEHHMFTNPKEEYIKDFESRPGEVIGDLWDLVMNGVELGSGSIRVTDPKLQERIMKFIGITKDEAEEKFGFLLEAYKYGAPIHGGMGLGIDRIVAMMQGLTDIREVIAFPKNKNAECPMDGSPGLISDKQLKEIHIKIDKPK